MAGRALRRALQEKAAQDLVNQAADSESEDEDEIVTTKPHNPFAGLMGDSDDSEKSDSEDQDTSIEVKKGTKSVENNSTKESHPKEAKQPEQSGTSSSKKKKKKKKKNKSQPADTHDKSSQNDTGGVDEIEKSLQEIGSMLGEPVAIRGDLQDDNDDQQKTGNRFVLTVERRFLNADAELKRLFGSNILREDRRGAARDRHGRGVVLRKTILAVPKQDWPRLRATGLQMVQADTPEGSSDLVFKFVHAPDYQKIQLDFFRAVNSMDHARISAILQAHPFHIDSLLQMSEVLKMNEENQLAADLVERAIYSYENAFHTLFNVSAGNCRLDYNIFENRGFYLAMFRHIRSLGNRGCWRTAFEFCKLLLSLSPDDDPMSCMLIIDYLALRANENAWVKQLGMEWGEARQLHWLPNFAFSLAFAERQYAIQSRVDGERADLTVANSMLQKAILRFPDMVNVIANKCGATLVPDVANDEYFVLKSVTNGSSECNLRMLCVLYVWMSYELWKPPDVLDWLQMNAREVRAQVAASKSRIETGQTLSDEDKDYKIAADRRKGHYVGVPRNIVRHIVISECEDARSLISKKVNVTEGSATDPMPPPNQKTTYDALLEEQRAAQTHNIGTMEMLLRSMIPGFQEEVAAIAQDPRLARRAANRNDNRFVDLAGGIREALNYLAGENDDDGGPQAEAPEDID
eukprot:m.278259 g.278259  ORF g.278259 m.278259 type:complete len:690 (-) comp16315_c0_seq13:2983-5052(-)